MGDAANERLVVSRPLVPSYSTMEDAAEKAHYLKHMHRLCALTRRPEAFPGSNPVGLTREALPDLSRHPYLVALKSDGVRHLLYLTVRPGSTYENPAPVALMIDRALHVYEVDVCATEDYFLKGTVLDGELVAQQPHEERLVFLVFDCLVVKGECLAKRPFHERLEHVRCCVVDSCTTEDVNEHVEETDAIAMVAHAPDVTMRAKTFVDLAHAPWLWSNRSQNDHRVDGLILQKREAAYNAGAAAAGSILKWKMQPTVDLAGPEARLSARDGPLPPRIRGRRWYVDPASQITARDDDDVLEYSAEVADDDRIRLFALRRRPDKKTANSIFVVETTLRECEEAIAVEELRPADQTPERHPTHP